MSIAAVKIGDSIQTGLDAFFGFVPNLLAFLVILLVGWLIAKVARTVINKLLDKVGVDRALHNSPAGEHVERISPGAKPSHLIGATAFWFIFLFALSAAIGALKIPALTTFITQVQNFLPNIIVATLILVGGVALAGALGGIIHKAMGDTPTGRIGRAVAPALVLVIATFMALNQLHIAQEIVTITYAALLGMLALAGALAFGLGGRDVAGRMLEDAYQSGQQNKDQVKQDMEVVKRRAEEQKQKAQGETHQTQRFDRQPDGRGDLGTATPGGGSSSSSL